MLNYLIISICNNIVTNYLKIKTQQINFYKFSDLLDLNEYV